MAMTRSEKWERTFAMIGAVGGIIGVLSGLLVLVAPGYESERTRSALVTTYLNGIVATNRSSVGDANSSTVTGTPAEMYASHLQRVWSAYRTADLGDFTGSSGTVTPLQAPPNLLNSLFAPERTYKVCMPTLKVLFQGCAIYGDFIFSPDNQSIDRFTINGTPIQITLDGWDGDNRVEGDEKDLVAQVAGRLWNPSHTAEIIVLRVSRNSTDNSFLELNQPDYQMESANTRLHAFHYLSPNRLGSFETKYMAFEVATDDIKFINLCFSPKPGSEVCRRVWMK